MSQPVTGSVPGALNQPAPTAQRPRGPSFGAVFAQALSAGTGSSPSPAPSAAEAATIGQMLGGIDGGRSLGAPRRYGPDHGGNGRAQQGMSDFEWHQARVLETIGINRDDLQRDHYDYDNPRTEVTADYIRTVVPSSIGPGRTILTYRTDTDRGDAPARDVHEVLNRRMAGDAYSPQRFVNEVNLDGTPVVPPSGIAQPVPPEPAPDERGPLGANYTPRAPILHDPSWSEGWVEPVAWIDPATYWPNGEPNEGELA